MDQDVKKYKVMHRVFITVIISTYLLIIVTFFTPLSSDIKLSIAILLVFLLLVFSILMRPKLFVLSIAYHFKKIKEQPNMIVKTNHNLATADWTHVIEKKGFKHYKTFVEYALYYRINLDPDDLLKRKGILEVVVIIKDDTIDYHDDRISALVNEIEEVLYQKNETYFHYAVFNLKSFDAITDDVMETADQVIYEKHKNHHVVVINGAFNESHYELYFLHNDAYAPTLLYASTVQTIKDII
ncbi:MAG: hypothetical protein ACNA7K_03275, partial [Acholeplasmataceae bacterium]